MAPSEPLHGTTPDHCRLSACPRTGDLFIYFLLAGHPGRTGRVFFLLARRHPRTCDFSPAGRTGGLIFFSGRRGDSGHATISRPGGVSRTGDFFLPARAPPDRRLPTSRPACPGETPFLGNSATTKVAAVSINFPTSTFYFLLYLTPSTSYLLPSTSYSTFLLQHPTYYLLHYPSINKPGGRSGGGRHFL